MSLDVPLSGEKFLFSLWGKGGCWRASGASG